MNLLGIFEIVFKLALAAILGGLIGLERESLNRPAGLRTYTLVSGPTKSGYTGSTVTIDQHSDGTWWYTFTPTHLAMSNALTTPKTDYFTVKFVAKAGGYWNESAEIAVPIMAKCLICW